MLSAASEVALGVALLAGCGGSGDSLGASDARGAESAQASVGALSSVELGKLDPPLRARVAGTDSHFPIRVSFARLPSRDELSTLMLVAYQRSGIGRVDRATLKVIAGRRDVRRITYLSGTEYGAEPADLDPSEGAG